MKSLIPVSQSSLTTLSTSTSLETFTLSFASTPSPAPIQYPKPPNEFVQNYITYVNRAIIAKKTARLGSSHV